MKAHHEESNLLALNNVDHVLYLILEVDQKAYNSPAIAESAKEEMNHHIKHLKSGGMTINNLHPSVMDLAEQVIKKMKL